MVILPLSLLRGKLFSGFTPSHWFSLFHALSLSHAHTHTHTHMHKQSRTHTHSLTHDSLNHSLTHTLSLSHTHTRSHSLIHTQTLTHTHTFCYVACFCLSPLSSLLSYSSNCDALYVYS